MVLEGHDLGHGSLISNGFICFLHPISMSRLPEVAVTPSLRSPEAAVSLKEDGMAIMGTETFAICRNASR